MCHRRVFAPAREALAKNRIPARRPTSRRRFVLRRVLCARISSISGLLRNARDKPSQPHGSSYCLLVNELALRIYLVEDNIIIRENLAATLVELTDSTVCGSARGENDAVAWFATHTDDWDLAIVDLFLLQGNGLGVVAALQSRHSKQKVAVLTNYASAAARDRCLKLGADVVFDKSHDIDELIAFCNAHNASA